MLVITMEDIIESNRFKKEACDNCKDALKDKLTPEQLQKFEDVFILLQKNICSVGKRKMLMQLEKVNSSAVLIPPHKWVVEFK